MNAADTHPMQSLAPVLFVAFVVWYVTREQRYYRAAVRAHTQTNNTAPSSARPDPSVEPACHIPGVPNNWSLDRYSKEGLRDIRIMLAQAARKHDNPDAD